MYRIYEKGVLRAGENVWTLPSHLIVKHEEVVVKCQYDSADQHTLVRDLVLGMVYNVTIGHTFTVVLITERTAHALSPSQQPEEPATRTDPGQPVLMLPWGPFWVSPCNLGQDPPQYRVRERSGGMERSGRRGPTGSSPDGWLRNSTPQGRFFRFIGDLGSLISAACHSSIYPPSVAT